MPLSLLFCPSSFVAPPLPPQRLSLSSCVCSQPTQGKAAAFRGLWLYGSHSSCAHAPGLACHFHPHFDCPEDVELNERDFEAHPRDVIPDEFAHRGAFWWYAHVTHFLLEENLEFRLKLSAAKAALGFQRPIIGVHVRNGDYCSFENDEGGLCLMYRHCICDGFEPYLERIRKMQVRKSPSVISSLKEEPQCY